MIGNQITDLTQQRKQSIILKIFMIGFIQIQFKLNVLQEICTEFVATLTTLPLSLKKQNS